MTRADPCGIASGRRRTGPDRPRGEVEHRRDGARPVHGRHDDGAREQPAGAALDRPSQMWRNADQPPAQAHEDHSTLKYYDAPPRRPSAMRVA
jgi:hypothetical protein